MINNTAALNSKKKYNLNYKNNYNSFKLTRWYKNHKTAFCDSLRTLYQAPFSNLLTMLILGIALALPVLLYLIIVNATSSLNSWQQGLYQYSLYLNSNYTEQQAYTIKNKLQMWPEISSIDIITKEQGLAELKEIMGIEEVLTNIDSNPLPIVLVANLKPEYHNPDNIKNLISKSKNISGVAKAEADIFWLEKLTNLLNLFSYMIYIFFIILGLAILLVISNTLRLILENKQKEMLLYSMLGATNSYIRRPYLYGGISYGFFAGLISYIVASFLFNKLFLYITSLDYMSVLNINIIGFSSYNILILLFSSSLLGWLGARISLYWQIKKLKNQLVEI